MVFDSFWDPWVLEICVLIYVKTSVSGHHLNLYFGLFMFWYEGLGNVVVFVFCLSILFPIFVHFIP